MFRFLNIAVAVLFVFASGDARATSATTSQPSLEERMRQWTIAFVAGEDAMRSFLTTNIAPESLEKRSVDERVKGYRKLRSQFGTLRVERILSSRAGEIEAVLIARDGSEHEFIFTGQEKTPFKIVSIAYRQHQHGH